MTFLELCQDFVREYGLAGGSGPNAVTGQTGELGNVVRWIRDSELYIQNLWRDWTFLWFEHSETIAAGQPAGPAFSVRKWDPLAFYFDRGTTAQRQVHYEHWDRFRTLISGAADPQIVTTQPNGTLKFDAAVQSSTVFYGEGWKIPTPMVDQGDTPAFPAAYDRLILARAAIMYGNREDAPEIISGAEAEYIDLLEKLESDFLPGFESSRSAHHDEPEVGAIPGFD